SRRRHTRWPRDWSSDLTRDTVGLPHNRHGFTATISQFEKFRERPIFCSYVLISWLFLIRPRSITLRQVQWPKIIRHFGNTNHLVNVTRAVWKGLIDRDLHNTIGTWKLRYNCRILHDF